MGWSEEAAQSHGLPFIHQLSTSLWTLDGHHDSLEDRSCAIPSAFKKFNGYQNPEKHKHVGPMLSAVQLHNTGKQLMQIAQQLRMQRMEPAVTRLRNDVDTLGRSMEKNANYLDEKCAAVSANHARTLPVRSPACDHERLELLNAVQFVEPSSQAKYSSLVSALRCADEFSPVFVNDYEPDDASSRRTYRSKLRCSLPFPVVLFTYSHGNNLGDYLYAWTVPTDVPDAELMLRNHAVMKDIESSLPTYHTRQMKKEFQHHAGRLCKVEPAVLRWMYQTLTGDSSGAATSKQAEVDRRVILAGDSEDHGLLWDLRKCNEGRPAQYDRFWEECSKYLEEAATTAVDDC